MSIYKKLQQARDHIKGLDLKKQGFNSFSKYNYYTPEQINYLVNEACNKAGLITKFDLIRDENGLHGILTIIDIDNSTDLSPELIFKQATDIPSIKATNITQQIGGAVTYTHRYLLMTAFDIVDNNLDFDTSENTKKVTEPKKSTGKQGIMIDNLLRNAIISPKHNDEILANYESYDFETAKKCIEYLKENQLPGIENQNPSQTDIKEHLKTK